MKKIQNQETKLVTLKQVISKASKDKDFLNSLLKAPKPALRGNALKLSEADGKKLNTLIAKYRKGKIDSGKQLGGARLGPQTFGDWDPI